MPSRIALAFLALCIFAASILAAPIFATMARAEDPGPFTAPKGALREQDHRVPLAPAVTSGGFMIVTIFRPQDDETKGETPHPVVILSHGSPGPRPGTRAAYSGPTRWLVEQGFVVVMLNRRGHGLTGGKRPDLVKACGPYPDFFAAGLETSKDFEAALLYLHTLPYAKADDVIVMGQSTGGWAATATASRNLPGVRAAINIAGGRSSDATCDIDALRIAAMARFGETARVPMLWLYTENDKSFGPKLSRAMAAAFQAAGGRADYHLLPPFGDDGHKMFGTNSSVPVWSPYVRDFLAKNGLLPAR